MENGNELVAMTGDELAAELYLQQGYLIFGSDEPMEIGRVFRENGVFSDRGPMQTPLRIVGVATRDEFYRQTLLGADIWDRPTATRAYPPDGHYYRVEAAD